MTSRVKEIHRFGQSIWYDNIERGLLLGGGLKQLIDEDGINGLMTNPAVFEKAVRGSQQYDADIARLFAAGLEPAAIVEELLVWDVAKAADSLLDIYKASGRTEGYVSLDIDPALAHDIEGTVNEAKRLYGKVSRANIMIKVPATVEGVEAVRQLTILGINTNVILIFSLAHYMSIAQAYIRGIEERITKGLPIDQINSVASFFVRRIDTVIDRQLNEMALKEKDEALMEELEKVMGRAAIAQAKVVYDAYRRTFNALQFSRLRDKKATVQRLLFGSTSTKNPSYSDVKYIEELIGDGTIIALPSATLNAFRDHGKAKATLNEGLNEAKTVLAKLQSYGISLEKVCEDIQSDGIEALMSSQHKLVKAVESKRPPVTS
jgi:transaldolase